VTNKVITVVFLKIQFFMNVKQCPLEKTDVSKEPRACLFNILGEPHDRISHFQWSQPFMLFVPRNVGTQFAALNNKIHIFFLIQ
jgi:hypothetical protein